jgi:hypothetical protein
MSLAPLSHHHMLASLLLPLLLLLACHRLPTSCKL